MKQAPLSLVVLLPLVSCQAVPHTESTRVIARASDEGVERVPAADTSVASAPRVHAAWEPVDEALATTVAAAQAQSNGFAIGGWLRTRYATSSDVTSGGNDLGGFNLDNARLTFSGNAAEGFDVFVSLEAGDPAISDAASPGVGLLDAYTAVKLCDSAAVSVGRFSATFLWSSGIEDRRLVFLDRGFLGEATDGRDTGVEFSGAFDRFNWWVAAQNGSDAAGDELALSARASVHVLGDSLCGSEGACGLGDAEHLTIGLAWFDDQNLDDGTAIGADVLFAKSGWSGIAELVDFQDDIRPDAAINTSSGIVVPSGAAVTGAETPWNVSVAYMFVPEQWEAAVRWQDLDDDADTTIVTAAVSRYSAGHNAKWTLQFDSASSDTATLDADTLAAGLTVGW